MKSAKILALVVLLAAVATSPITPVHRVTAQDPSGNQHCVALVSPIPINSREASQVLEVTCFSTIADSIAFATHNRVILPRNASAGDAAQALRQAERMEGPSAVETTYVVGIYWKDSNRGGSSYVVVGSQMCGAVHYGIQNIGSQWGSQWNDAISSAEGYANCNWVELYEHINYNNWLFGSGGAVQYCHPYCASLGAMNDRTSSTRLMP